MNDEENGVVKNLSTDIVADNLSNSRNYMVNKAVVPLKVENPINCAEDTSLIKNPIENVDSDVADMVVNDIQQFDLDSPSTSTSNLTVEQINLVDESVCVTNDPVISSSDLSQCTSTLTPNYPDISFAQNRPSTLFIEKSKRKILKINPGEISMPDSPLGEENNEFFRPETYSFDELENSTMVLMNDAQEISDVIPELTLVEERTELRNWKACTIAGIERQIDLKVIEPYKRVLSHGGYSNIGPHSAIIIFSACFLPHRSRKDYNYVMDNLFFYILHTLNQLVTDDYILIYLHGGITKDCIPTFSWLKRCYKMTDRKFKKNLKRLYLVHPTFLLRTFILMMKPFINSKFNKKVQFVNSLADLNSILPIEEASIPDKVRQYDRIIMSLLKK